MNSDTPADRRQQVHLTTRELALRWRMSVETLKKWRVKSQGPAWIQISARHIVYPIAAVHEWEQRHAILGRQ